MKCKGSAGKPLTASLDLGLAIAVPTELQGLWLAHQRHGSLPWAQLVAPVLAPARNGFPAHPYLTSSLTSQQPLYALQADVAACRMPRCQAAWWPARCMCIKCIKVCMCRLALCT